MLRSPCLILLLFLLVDCCWVPDRDVVREGMKVPWTYFVCVFVVVVHDSILRFGDLRFLAMQVVE